MSRTSNFQREGLSRASIDSEFAKTAVKKRKSNGFRGAIRKLFRRKTETVKSHISLPTSTMALGHDPTSFITSATDNRFQRAVSLPLPSHEVSRRSALGSHAPFTFQAPKKVDDKEMEVLEERPSRARRASLPSVVINPSDLMQHGSTGNRDLPSRDGQHFDDQYIGFAVTSGSNPKRRSRSADAFYDSTRGHRMSPIQWRHWRGRSDEIRYWRESVCPTPAFDREAQDGEAQEVESTQAEPYENNIEPIPEIVGNVDKEILDTDNNRGTFDFGILASSMRQQDKVALDERVMTLEVKLMDLEYAISKLQARAPSPGGPTPHHLHPTLQKHRPSPDSTRTPQQTQDTRPSPASSNQKTLEGSGSTTTNSMSTQPTSPSFDDDPFVEQKRNSPRPISTATAITVRGHSAEQPPSPAPSEKQGSRNTHRNSITSLTIEHFTTLIGLIRREQAARIRLEDQLVELQRQLNELKPSSPSPPRSRCRSRGWIETNDINGSKRSLSYRGAHPVTDNDETDTDDEYREAYETPTERTGFDPLSFKVIEGEAF